MTDSLFRGSLLEIDPSVFELTQLEAERQYRRLILIPSESTSPLAVRQALSTAFHNIYAEGYPDEYTRWLSEEEILDYASRLNHYRRYSDPRYYKGVEYANIIEALARRRAAETFAANGLTPDDLYVNVQALSGGPANNAVYHALVKPGDTVMGMDLLHGGHLSHGAPVNRSGKYFNMIHYTIDPDTEKINYDKVAELARQHAPKMIIAGFSSYPWQADWNRFREIADEVGAYLLADMAHVAGLIAGGAYPSPVGIADVVSSTTHKTLHGPRGALLLTHKANLARKLDRAVFPGEQGGPHVNVFAALAVALKLAQTEHFAELQRQTVKNCIAFTEQFKIRGFKIPFGGTDTHLMNLDMSSIKGPDGTALSGDIGARILDLAGIVVNRNTIPGDRSAFNPSGVRMGTPWITQRGFTEKETVSLANIIADLLEACIPYKQRSSRWPNSRSKVDNKVLEDARTRVREMALKAEIDFEPPNHGYPHFFYSDDTPLSEEDWVGIEVSGEKATQFLHFALSCDVGNLTSDKNLPTMINMPDHSVTGTLSLLSNNKYLLSIPTEDYGIITTWLRALSDGFVQIDKDILRKLPGPVSINESPETPVPYLDGDTKNISKPYYIGINYAANDPLPEFNWVEKDTETKKTALFETHRQMGAKMVPFAGWDMPVWYSSVIDEHVAVRQKAGLFDVSHMGVYQVEGPNAPVFLDSVCANNISALNIGQSLYAHFLDPDANVIDDLLVYRRDTEKYLVVVNASNDDKDWAWLNAVMDGNVLIDRENPSAKAFGRNVTLRNLRDPKEGEDMLVDIALQGPKSRDILLSLGCDEKTHHRVLKLKRTELCEATIGGFDLVVSRTGYTGEKMAFELFVHPDRSVDLWNALLANGEEFGLKPVGLGARDSLRTEAGLPLYGHEMGGEFNLGVGDAGFRTYVKTYKPWFIGRKAFLEKETKRKSKVIRFRFAEKAVRIAHLGDPVIDKRGKTMGFVTSCAVDKEGMLTGLAYVDEKYSKIDTPIYIFQGAPQKGSKAPAELEPGDRVSLPSLAMIISRFPKK